MLPGEGASEREEDSIDRHNYLERITAVDDGLELIYTQ